MQRSNRLKKEWAFEYVYKKGAKSPEKDLVLLFAKSREGLKVGFSVSKKVGNSVTRNAVKRRLREQFTTLLPFVEPDFIYVVAARPSIAECPFDEIGRQLKSALFRAGKLKNDIP